MGNIPRGQAKYTIQLSKVKKKEKRKKKKEPCMDIIAKKSFNHKICALPK